MLSKLGVLRGGRGGGGIGEDSKKLGLQKGRPFFEEETTPHYLNHFANLQ